MARLQGELGSIRANLASKNFRELLAAWLKEVGDLLKQSSPPEPLVQVESMLLHDKTPELEINGIRRQA